MHGTDLENMSRKELQALAKEYGIKANLSNVDIMAKLSDIFTKQVAVEEIPRAVNKVSFADEKTFVVEEAVLPLEVSVNQEQNAPEEEATTINDDSKVGDVIEANIDNVWKVASIKRINKKTLRICLADSSEEHTVKFTEIRTVQSQNDTTTKAEEGMELTGLSVEPEVLVEMEIGTIEEALTVQETNSQDSEQQKEEEEEEASMNVDKIVVESTASEKIIVESEMNATLGSTVIFDTVVNEPLASVVEEAPAITLNAPPTPVASARTSSIGWSVLDSAVKPTSNRRKERRNARRSAMKQLAESMKMENLKAEADAEAETEAKATTNSEEVASTATMEVTTEDGVDVALAIAVAPVAPIAPVAPVAPVASVAVLAVVPVPVQVHPIASTQVTVQSATITPAQAVKGEMLPRMNKAQMMRLGATQKKIDSTDGAPSESVAFTNKVTKPTPSFTPSHHRSSICTSAPQRKAATPLSGAPSGRASMLVTSGNNKRKLSDVHDRASIDGANSTAPNFKRMHIKQFNALKSIAECVDQDKAVGARMTTAMEAAMSSAPKVQPVSSHSTAAIAKPAANPFNKVLGGTPAKAKAASTFKATPAPLAPSSRPASGNVHTANNTFVAKNNNGSSNIIKSRTVTSFVSTTAAPSSCGHNNLTSFVNNENSMSAHQNASGGPTSFLKGKDSIGTGKHRTVIIPGANNIRKQRLTMM